MTGLKSTASDRQQTEDEIRRLLADGDHAAAASHAIRAYGPEILGFLVNVMNDADAANEAYSQCIEDIWRGIAAFVPRATFRTWAYCIARHACARYYRDPYLRRGRRLLTEEMEKLARETLDSVAEPTRTDETVEWIRRQLAPEDREILALHYERGLNWSEVSEILGISHAAARKRFQRVKDRIRRLLAESRANAI